MSSHPGTQSKMTLYTELADLCIISYDAKFNVWPKQRLVVGV